MQVMDLNSTLSPTERDIPFGKLVGGRNDQSLAALTPDVIQAYQDLDDAGYSSHIYWDERGHVYTEGSYWSGSYRQTAEALTAYRSDQSFPAFFNVDQDFEMPGRQPDIGNGGSDDGDPWGTWGGYFSWDAETIVDSASIWRATVYLNSSGDYPVDIPGFDSSLTDISFRRPQQFNPPDSGSISWELKRLSDSRVLQSGWEKVGKDAVVNIPDVTLYKEKCELVVTVVPTSISAPKDLREAPLGSGILHVYPNPVSSISTIEFQISRPGNVRIKLHNMAGLMVDVIADEYQPAGRYSVRWDSGSHPSGIYIGSLKAGPEVIRRKIILSR
jgi:hypothetical protein